ncbi:UNVERIFIED_CONTAM: Ent-kaurene oxidase, chloroplastic [Sesamum radiatum]|uniref:Ent-kaurene oxidase, chloroplastic n=1 Tax=Sesamum radiatum TaxID=300843 RepID=A0AAW2M595_SESRA
MDTLLNLQALPSGAAIGGPAVALGGITLFFIRKYVEDQKKKSSGFPPPPEVPGLPVIGNLLQLKEKKPHKTFTKWAAEYGPIYSIKTGSNTMVVLNSNNVAKEAIGEDVKSIYVEELGTTLSRQEIFKILVIDPMEGAIDVDWRDFFPYLKWIPNKSFENKIRRMHFHRQAVMKALIEQQRKRIASGTIAINIYGCNMDQRVWESPDEWKPERFLNAKEDTTELHKTMAFGSGKRACAGALQAMLISCVAIARFVQEFEWRLKEGEEANVDTLGLTTHKLHPLLTIIKPRNAG